MLQLVDEGKVSLDAPIADFLPGVVSGNGYDGTRITVRHLLQHTGGLAPFTPQVIIDQPPSNPDGTYDLAVLVRKGLSHAPVSAPGAGFAYSNTNYLVLGMLIEKVTGRPVHENVTRRVIEPLGLGQTVFPAPGDRSLPAPAVNGYHGLRVGGFFLWTPALSYDPSLFSSAGAMISTLEDLTAFYRALIAGKVVSAAGLAEMRKLREVGPGVAFGLGIGRKELSCGVMAWGHSGGVPGYMSQTLVTEDGRHASVVTNALFQVGMLRPSRCTPSWTRPCARTRRGAPDRTPAPREQLRVRAAPGGERMPAPHPPRPRVRATARAARHHPPPSDVKEPTWHTATGAASVVSPPGGPPSPRPRTSRSPTTPTATRDSSRAAASRSTGRTPRALTASRCSGSPSSCC